MMTVSSVRNNASDDVHEWEGHDYSGPREPPQNDRRLQPLRFRFPHNFECPSENVPLPQSASALPTAQSAPAACSTAPPAAPATAPDALRVCRPPQHRRRSQSQHRAKSPGSYPQSEGCRATPVSSPECAEAASAWPAARAGSFPGPHRRANLRHQQPALARQREDLPQRDFKIFLDVVAQCLERRNVKHSSPGRTNSQPAPCAPVGQCRREKRSEGFPRPCRSRNQRGAPGKNMRPPLLLWLGRRAELPAGQTTPPPEGVPRPATQEGTASGYSNPKSWFRQPFAQ